MKILQTSSTQRNNPQKILLLLVVLLIMIACMSLCLGAEQINILHALTDLITGNNSTAVRILQYVRLPRTCAGLLAGAALAASGTIIQGVLANSLAAPSTIGVNAGAGFTVALFCAVAPGALMAVPFAALAGAFGGAMLVLSIAEHTSASKISLVLAGVAVSGIFSAGIDAIITFVPESLNGYSDFRIGGLFNVSLHQLFPAAILIFIALIAACSLHNELDLLMLGTEQAQSLGLPAHKMQILFLAIAAILAGSAVSFAGLIGFVGLMVPHIMRQLVGETSGILLVSSALGGAILLCGCDLLARLLFAPFELPVGIVMALIGGPFFIWLLKKRGRYKND